VELSQVFEDLLLMKKDKIIKDFSYYEPSLHHAFIALSTSEKSE